MGKFRPIESYQYKFIGGTYCDFSTYGISGLASHIHPSAGKTHRWIQMEGLWLNCSNGIGI